MQHALILGDEEFNLALSRSRDGYRLHLAGRTLPCRLVPGEHGGWVLHTPHGADDLSAAVDGDTVHIHLDGNTYSLRFEHALQRLAQLNEASAADVIKATMPGSLISLAVAGGDTVKQGQVLLVMESMKMETTIVAPRDGVVADLHVEPGQTFDKDAVLLSLEPEEEAE